VILNVPLTFEAQPNYHFFRSLTLRGKSMNGSYETLRLIRLTDEFSAHNYHPLPAVFKRAEGIWVWDPEGNKYIDFLSAYSAMNHGHRHPRIITAMKRQLDEVTLTARAFHNTELGPFCEALAKLCRMEMVLPMNTGAEAVETALKTARKWGYFVKGVEPERAEIIVFENNFHGRTITIVSFSTET
jgi:ornithine--oxo-acid transaminase